MNTKKILVSLFKEMNISDQSLQRIDFINNNCARDCYDKHFFTFKHRYIYIYDFEITNGDFVSGINSDKKLNIIVRENGFIHNLIIKTFSSLSNKNIQ